MAAGSLSDRKAVSTYSAGLYLEMQSMVMEQGAALSLVAALAAIRTQL